MPHTIVVFVNAASGAPGKQAIADDLAKEFARHGAQAEVVVVKPGCDLCEEVHRAVREGARIAVAAGGDGTVNAVASVVAGTETALGVLPLGTLNHFAKDLGIPLDLAQAVETIVQGEVRRVDVAEVNGKLFVNNSSVGVYPTVVRKRDAQQRLGKGKWSAFAHAMLTVVGRYPLIRVTVKADGRAITRKTSLVFIGNNEYELNGLRIGKRSRLDAGKLAAYLPHGVGRWRIVWFALRGLFGRLRDGKDFDVFHAVELSIVVNRPKMTVATDGEVIVLDMPLEYRIRPGGLAVVAPPQSAANTAPTDASAAGLAKEVAAAATAPRAGVP
jgi:diacylglycerol kinase family enzyme